MDIVDNKISFKSVGVRYNEKSLDTSKEDLPVAIKMPMSLGQANDGLFAMTFDMKSTIRQNLRSLLLTNKGERVCKFTYGCDLRSLTMEYSNTSKFDDEAAIRIKSGVAKWMPYVELTDMSRTVDVIDQQGIAKVKLKIFYNVPNLNINSDCIEVILYISG